MRRSARIACRLLLLAIVAAAALAGDAAGARAAGGPYYVSLGDSLALGEQPDARGHDRPTNQGYVDVTAAGLARLRPGVTAVKLGCGGATTTTVLFAPACHGAPGGPSQLERAEGFLAAHAGHLAAVTVNIGDNDVEGCLSPTRGIDQACLARGTRAIRRNLPSIAQRLRRAAGPGVPVVGVVDYDQFLALWLRGRGGRALARQSVGLVRDLNALVGGIYRRVGIGVADGARAFATEDLTTMERLPGHGQVPRAVARICRWTWACSPAPIGLDDHANATGYRVIGSAVLAALARARR